jgi:hypothetical protein
VNQRLNLIAAASLALPVAISTLFAAAPVAHQDRKQQDPMPAAAPQGMPPMPPAPGEHHKWLEQLLGTWTVEIEMTAPGIPPMKSTGTDTVRSLRGRWIMCELNAETPGMGSMTAVLTLGYNPETGKYQGTWVDSVNDHLWVYVGTLDATGKILTLETEGPNMIDPAKGLTRYRDVIELKTADHRTLTSFADADGNWVQVVTANYRKTAK